MLRDRGRGTGLHVGRGAQFQGDLFVAHVRGEVAQVVTADSPVETSSMIATPWPIRFAPQT